jgi:hypothetical protein
VKNRPFDVHRKLPPDLFLVDGLDRCHHRDAGVVDQDVEAPELSDG